MDQEFSAEVLVLGGGVAGLTAAIKARELGADVILVCKATAGSSGAALTAGGHMAYFRGEDLEKALERAISTSDFLDDQVLDDIIVRKRLDGVVEETMKWGVKYVKRDGQYVIVDKGRKPSLLYDGGGHLFIWSLRAKAVSIGVKIIDRTMIFDLLTSDGRHPTKESVIGAMGFGVHSGDFYTFKAKSTVLATGAWNIQAIYSEHTWDIAGDGHAMGFRAGAEMKNMEQCGWQLKSCHTPHSQAQGCGGGITVNKDGEKIEGVAYGSLGAKEVSADEKLSSRAATALSYRQSITEGKGLFGSLRGLKAEDIPIAWRVYPVGMRASKRAGYDLPRDLVRLTISLYAGGIGNGLKANEKVETSLPGLYAAGDVSRNCCGIRGIGGALMTGYIAAENAVAYSGGVPEPTPSGDQVERLKSSFSAPLKLTTGLRPIGVWRKLPSIVESALGLEADDERLKETIKEVEAIIDGDLPKIKAVDSHELMKANEVKNMVSHLILVLRAARMRTESRLAHFRADYPKRDDKNWLKWICAKLGENGETKFWTEDIPTPFLRPKGA